MTDENLENVEVPEVAVEETPAPVEEVSEKVTATEAVAEETPIENVKIEEVAETVTNDDGEKVIAGPKKTKTSRKSNSFVTDNGAVASRAADAALKKKVNTEAKKTKSTEQAAVWSEKNMRWNGVGEVSKGYNIVTKEAAAKWLTMQGVREATPEEVAAHYGK